jgi:hypothetical protein
MVTLEASGTVPAQWRQPLVDLVAWLMEPSAPRWQLTLGGAGLAVLAIVVSLAQFLPPRRTIPALRVDKQETGSTIVTALVIHRRLAHELGQIDGVHTVTPQPHANRLIYRIELIDSANARRTAEAVRTALTPEVWGSLGVEPRRVDCIITYRRSATPVTRKEQPA